MYRNLYNHRVPQRTRKVINEVDFLVLGSGGKIIVKEAVLCRAECIV